jgi:hypothetical protein
MQVGREVVHRQMRPLLPQDMPPALARLLTRCWDPEAAQRPGFQEILLALLQLRSACMVGGPAWCGG